MEIELAWQGYRRWPLVAGSALVLVGLAALALLGRSISPSVNGEPALLTPERWQAVALGRQVVAETERLQEDITSIHALLQFASPDPVQAMLLAERVYARQRTGASATAAARQSVISAAGEAARYATGAGTRQEALDAYAGCLALINTLSAGQGSASPPSVEPGPVRP